MKEAKVIRLKRKQESTWAAEYCFLSLDFLTEGPIMEITYALEPKDLCLYNKLVISRVPAFRAIFALRLVVVPLGLFLLFASQSFPLWLSGLVGVGFAVIWVPFCLWSARRHQYKSVRDHLDLLAKRSLKIGPDGVRQITDRMDTLMQWSSFTEIAESPEQLCLFMNRKFAVVIPKRAFTGLEEAHAFLQASRDYKAGLDVKASAPNGTWPPPPRIGA